MSVGQVQLYDHCFHRLGQSADVQWDAASATNWYWILTVPNQYTPADTHTTVADLGTASTDWIDTGDGAPLVRATGTIVNNVGIIEYQAGNANWGSSVTISAKYLIAVQGDSAGPLSTDLIMFYQDLAQESPTDFAQSSSSDFIVNAPANNVWFQINKQA